MYFGPDSDEAARFIAGQFAGILAELDAATRDQAITALREDMAGHHTDRGVHYDAASWLVLARRPDLGP
jgi:hypothetical protein